MVVKKKKKKSTAITVVKEKKEIWAGAQSLMTAPTTDAKKAERNLIILTAKAINVSPFGINILGNVPYINKLGLKEKQEQYSSDDRIIYSWAQRAKDDNEKAICDAKIVRGSKDLCDWVTGECSPSTIKMSTLKGYQNHMAQTRARNRAILETYGVKIHEEMMTNIQKMIGKKEVTEEVAGQIGGAITTSVEEAIIDKNNKKEIPPITPKTSVKSNATNYLEQLKAEVYKASGMKKDLTEEEAIKIVNTRTGLKLKDLKLSEKHAQIVLFTWLDQKK